MALSFCRCSKYSPETRSRLPGDKPATVHVEAGESVPLSKLTTVVAAVVSASARDPRFVVFETEPERSGIWGGGGGISKLLC